MGSHPINLLLRFILELAALSSLGIWGWRQSDGWPRFVFALAIPIGIAGIWAIFAVPNDSSRSGAAPVPTPGIVRLTLELIIFALACMALFDSGYDKTGLVLGILVVLHYSISYDRIYWLISQ